MIGLELPDCIEKLLETPGLVCSRMQYGTLFFFVNIGWLLSEESSHGILALGFFPDECKSQFFKTILISVINMPPLPLPPAIDPDDWKFLYDLTNDIMTGKIEILEAQEILIKSKFKKLAKL